MPTLLDAPADMPAVVLDFPAAVPAISASQPAGIVCKCGERHERIPRDPVLKRWLAGHAPMALGGRTKGSRNRISASEIVKQREARLATRYVKRAEVSDTVLMHVMDKLIPNKSLLATPSLQMIVFVGDGTPPRAPSTVPMVTDAEARPPQLLVSPSLSSALSVAVPAVS